MAKKAILPRVDLQKERFLSCFAEIGTVTHAAKAAGINVGRHYEWLQNDPEYPNRYKEAREKATDTLEKEARRRALEGTETPVFYLGEQVGTVRKYSDLLLIFLLKGARPEVYRERYDHRISGGEGGPIEIRTASMDDFEAMCEHLASTFGRNTIEVKRAIIQALESNGAKQPQLNATNPESQDTDIIDAEEVHNICMLPVEGSEQT